MHFRRQLKLIFPTCERRLCSSSINMGCLLVKLGFRNQQHETLEEEPQKVFSWDKRPKIDVSNYMFDGLKDQTVGKLPGAIDGQQFIIQNCQNCNIYLFDYSNTVTVDDCVNCRIFIGPIQTSIFIRDCTDCKFVLACQQFRLRDCHRLEAFLCCATQPIIESSSGVKLACYSYYYPELAGQFKSSGLSVFNNNWSNIHDFSQDPTEKHYTLLPEDYKLEDCVPLPSTEELQCVSIDLDPDKSVVPRSLGQRRKTSDEIGRGRGASRNRRGLFDLVGSACHVTLLILEESCLVVFFHDESSQTRALTVIDQLREKHPECVLVQTKELKMESRDAERVFGSDMYNVSASKGPVIGLEYNGDNSIVSCQEVVMDVTQGTSGLVFVSESKEYAEQQIENYYNFADMQMAV